ncbi:MAG: UDP-3-O-(3-hydroxymyristoyl)glucosamine N-acyltransferase [Phycisphaerae bacterium]|nr:UDP-3-O-(3-hydroxymyristoyl)glucosamine N-acyltransferase [Phycisphaerae bacterium]
MTLRQIAECVGGTVEGDAAMKIRGLASLSEAGPDDLTFAAEAKHVAALSRTRAAAAMVSQDAQTDWPGALLRVSAVPLALGRLLASLAGPEDLPPAGVAASAVVDPAAQVAPDAAVGPNVTIGPRVVVGAGAALCAGVALGADVHVGEKCVLQEGVVVRSGCVLGDRVRIGPNSVIGADGYGYFYTDGVHHKIPHAGNVVIEDDVELGACVCVDRAKWGSTRIGAGAKIDNLCQIAHAVQIGPGVLLAAQVGVAGSTKIGAFAMFGGKVGVRDNIEIAPRAVIGACACIAQSVETTQPQMGIPSRDMRSFLQQQKALEKLPELLRRVKKLERQLGSSDEVKENTETT